jgi:hypothetical protein
MGRRRIHTQGGAIDLSVLGQPQTTPLSMLSHPALMSNVGIHNVLQGVHSPLHPNTLRSTGGDLKGDLKHLAYHHLQSGKRGHDLMDHIYHSGRQLLGVGLYAQPHGGDLLDSIYHTGRHLIDRGHDGKPLVDMLLHHHGRGLSAEPMVSGGSFVDTLTNKLGDRAIDMAFSHLFGGELMGGDLSDILTSKAIDSLFEGAELFGAGMRPVPRRLKGRGIPSPPSRSPITDPSLVGMGAGENAQSILNAISKSPLAPLLQIAQPIGNAIGHAIKGSGAKPPRKGRFVKGSAEAKAYMASIRKKK